MAEKIAVVAHDAGAANHIISWLRTGYIDGKKVSICFAGPAAIIYEKVLPGFMNNGLEDALQNATMLISGTGWASSLEHDARYLACNKGVKSIAVLDHWTNYRQRFSFNANEVLPEELWVVDEYAQEIAKRDLPELKVVLQRNDFIALQKQEVESIARDDQDIAVCDRVLFVMEPIRQQWGNSDTPGEVQALTFFIEHMHRLMLPEVAEIIIRPHPSDPAGKYDAWLDARAELNISVDESSSLAQLLAWSDVVVGCQTYAMVVAVAIGKKVVSSLPPNAPRCLLPHKEIIHLSELV